MIPRRFLDESMRTRQAPKDVAHRGRRQQPAASAEVRIAPDGVAYTKIEFVEFFGSTREWDQAAARKAASDALNAAIPPPAPNAPAPSPLPKGAKDPTADVVLDTKATKATSGVVIDAWSSFEVLYVPDEQEAQAVAELAANERAANVEAQDDELMAVEAIYERETRYVAEGPEAGADDGRRRPKVVELCVPLLERVEGADAHVARVVVPPGLRGLPQTSGLHCADDGLFALTTLPPLVLRLRRPLTYPSRSPPVVALRCAWLSDEELAHLATQLDEVFATSLGMPAICEAVEWLRSSALSSLPSLVLDHLALPATPAAATTGAALENTRLAVAGRAARWPRSAPEVLSALCAHAQSDSERLWREKLHTCGVCFEEHASLDCVRFIRCKHTFCKGCVGTYFESLMADGAASALNCPEPSCRAAANPFEVKALLSPALYERYEKLQTDTCLSAMHDVVWCPRCEYPAFLVEGDESTGARTATAGGPTDSDRGAGRRLALCGSCAFSFCCECRLAWHGLAPCANLATRWRNADEQGREELRRKYGKSVVDEVESAEWMLKHTKPCPNCSTSVEKNGGCNHITCRHCNFEWCWLCNCKYQPGHYRKGSGTGCEQFSQDFFDELDLTREEFDARFVVLNHM